MVTDVGGQEIKKLEEQGLQPKYLHFSALSDCLSDLLHYKNTINSQSRCANLWVQVSAIVNLSVSQHSQQSALVDPMADVLTNHMTEPMTDPITYPKLVH